MRIRDALPGASLRDLHRGQDGGMTSGTGPVVAVVVPEYATRDHVRAAVESVQAQTYPDRECVVVDDGSPDDSAAVATGSR